MKFYKNIARKLTLRHARVFDPFYCDDVDCCCFVLLHGDSLLLRVVKSVQQMLQSSKSIESSSTLINPFFFSIMLLFLFSRSLFFKYFPCQKNKIFLTLQNPKSKSIIFELCLFLKVTLTLFVENKITSRFRDKNVQNK